MPLTRIDSAFLDLDALGGIDFDVQSGIPTLKVDAVNHRIGIGNNSPTQKLDVAGNVNISSGSNYLVDGSQISTANIAENASYLYFTDARASSAITGSALDMGSNNITTTGKVLFANMYSAIGDLPSASTYHGMFAHVHETGRGYFAHGGNWVRLLDESGGSTGSLSIDGNVSSTTQFSGFDGLRIHNANGASFGVTADMYFTAGTGSSNRGAAIGSELVSGYGNDLYFATNGGNVSSTNTLTERLRITSDGNLLVNTTTSRSVMDHVGNGPTPKIQIEATDSNAIVSIISAGTADANRCGSINLGRHRNGTVGATPTIVQDGDALGAVIFSGGDGGDMLTGGAKIHAEVDGTPGADNMPGALVFSTNPGSQGHLNNTERLRITSTGEIVSTNGTLIRDVNDSSFTVGGGTASNAGANINLYGASHSDSTLASVFRVRNGSTETFRITPGGNVGIGTDNPSYDLDVWGSVSTPANADGGGTTGNIRAVDTSSIAADTGGVISFSYLWNDPVGELGNPPYIKAVKTNSTVSNYGGGLAFGTRVHNGAQLERMRIVENGNVGIGTATPGYKLEVNGSFAATTKSFIIPHPTKEGMKLRHGSLEGPENGVYVRGRSCLEVIDLPDYWTALVDPDSITVVLTSIGPSGPSRVERIENNKVYVFSEDSRPLDYFYMINAERIDVEPLEVEISG